MATNQLTSDRISSNRQKLLVSILPNDVGERLSQNLKDSNGSLPNAISKLSNDEAQQVVLLNSLAEAADDHEAIVSGLATGKNVKSLRDVAAKFNTSDIASLAGGKSLASSSQTAQTENADETENADATHIKTAQTVRRKLFLKEPTAVLHKMVQDGHITIEDDEDGAVRNGVATFLQTVPETFSIHSTPITDVLNEDPVALKDLHPEVQKKVVSNLKTLQRVQALTSTPAAVPVLWRKGFKSANQVAAVPVGNFVQDLGGELDEVDVPTGESIARNIHAHATNSAIQMNKALTSTLQAVRGTGIRAIDGTTSRLTRITAAKNLKVSGKRSTVNLERLFGSLDFCACSDCISINSPAAYFVELLQFLRSNNLKSGYTPGWRGTALEMLLRRRPDLIDLELTCANTNTVLPYIDLSNEVMESFVVHLKNYLKDTNDPKQATIDVFNVTDDEDSSELLAQAVNVNYKAYCILKDAVYPFTLPYSQGLDEIRILLGFLGTSRYELLAIFRPPLPSSTDLAKWEEQARDRATAAEYLLLSQEEYKIITHEAFYSINYFQLTLSPQPISNDFYQQKIGLLSVYKYWGYLNGDWEVTDISEADQLGLTFVKLQFLQRSGLAYTDLVNLIQTKYVNPNYPSGWALLLLERLRWSYRYLMTLVDPNQTGDQKYDALIAFLVKYQPLAEIFEKLREQYLKNMSKANQQKSWDKLVKDASGGMNVCCCKCSDSKIWRCWVKRYFDLFGELLVLDSSDGTVFEVEGWFVLRVTELDSGPEIATIRTTPKEHTTLGSAVSAESPVDSPGDHDFGYLNRDGTITSTAIDGTMTLLGHIDSTGVAIDQATGNTMYAANNLDANHQLILQSTDKLDDIGEIRSIDSRVFIYAKEHVATWGPVQDSCNIDKVRLVKLNGNSVDLGDFDRMQRFIRLWRKLGWSIDDLDQALLGLSTVPEVIEGPEPPATGSGSSGPSGTSSQPSPLITWDDLNDQCGDNEAGGNGNGPVDTCPLHAGETWTPLKQEDISPGFIEQLVAVKKLLDLTGLGLPKLLSFWADISIVGKPNALYSRLFLTRNLLGMDQVFAADANGNYLSQSPPEKISAHLPVVMGAFEIRTVADITTLITSSGLPPDPDLTLSNISAIYRRVLLVKVISIKISLLPNVISLFGDPYAGGAIGTLSFINQWNKLNISGFSLAQMSYIIQDVEQDSLHPIGPSVITVLKTSKQLQDGLASIKTTYPDIIDQTKVTAATAPAFIGLVFDATTTAVITSVLEGTSTWTTNAPSGLTVDPTTVPKRLKYASNAGDASSPASATVTMTGILTAVEIAQAKTPALGGAWNNAIDRLMKQPVNWFNDTLFGIFPDQPGAMSSLLAGDSPPSTPVPTDTDPNPIPDPGTAPGKRSYFLQYFLPFLRTTLSDKLIINTMTSISTVSSAITGLLLSSILTSRTISALNALRTLEQSLLASTDWNGYLLGPANDSFTFIAVSDTQPAAITLDGLPVSFPHQQVDPSNVWMSDPINLIVGHLYTLFVPGQPATQLSWKTSRSPKSSIPTSALLSSFATSVTTDVFKKLVKAGIVINGFSLTYDEIIYLTSQKTDFDGFDLNAFTLKVWMRMNDYTNLRNNLQAPDAPLIDLFKWASLPGPADQISAKIITSTRWDSGVDALNALLDPNGFNLVNPAAFRNEIALVKLKKAIDVVGKLGVTVNVLFNWSLPVLKFWPSRAVADSIRKVVRSKYTITDWEKAVQPLNNTLREDMKNALIAYLVVQPGLIDQGVTDADSLFEFFLIDVQMSSCLQTSRIVQAISTVQLFIQRCLLGLEIDPATNQPLRVDALRWSWMSQYRVWEANRKVFLYPENWLIPTLRDDKSPFYVELESELLQKDINVETVTSAFKNYLFKVDEVANLQAEGLFLDGNSNILHIVSRTRHAPYIYYYRQLDTSKFLWTSWEKLGVDVPNYIVESSPGVVAENGTYVTPVVWNGRILVFFPQFSKKTAPPAKLASESMQTMGNENPVQTKSIQFWEVKMCFSERRDGIWTTKSISSDGVYEAISDPSTYTFPDLSTFVFIPRVIVTSSATEQVLSIDILSRVTSSGSTAVGTFNFTNGRLMKSASLPTALSLETTNFAYDSGRYTLHSWQAATATAAPETYNNAPYVNYPGGVMQSTVQVYWSSGNWVNFSHDFVHLLLGRLSTSENLADVFAYYASTSTLPETMMSDAYGGNSETRYHELKMPYAIYNWELGLHAPMTIIDKLVQQKQFDKALNMCHNIFNPMVNSNDPSACWQFRPFQEIVAKDYLENFFQSLVPDEAVDSITEWRDNPYAPYLVARSRPVAYMKAIVMKYISILIAYGDYYFRQNTLETVPLAIQMYIRASHVYGPAGQVIPKRGKTEAQTYRRLAERFDAFDNAVVELELEFPFSNQIETRTPVGFTGKLDTPVDFPNIFGSATTRYFCIPDNDQLTALRATIDNRLFKLRHCQDINGVVQKLPLFSPPIDVALLVQATAAGLSISAVLNDLNSPMPNYRFYFLLQKAHEVCADLKGLVASFLQAKEKKDSEALQVLRQQHEITVNENIMAIKTSALDEANKSLDSFQQSRLGPVYRMRHFLQLLGEDVSQIPADPAATFAELEETIEQLVDDGGFKLVPSEKEEDDQAAAARDLNVAVGVVETLAGIFHALPSETVHATPLGMGLAIQWGFPFLGNSSAAVARGLSIGVNYMQSQSSMAARRTGFLRSMQDRVMQANNAGYEIKSIDKQILTQMIRIDMATRDISNQQSIIDNSNAVMDFLMTKYTNTQLYEYLEGQTSTLSYQLYTLAYDLAKRAEKAFHFERPLDIDRTFIQFGYWDPGHDGLTSADALSLGLRQLEAAYQENRGYDFEVTKFVSLRLLAPLELVKLRELAKCQFSLPEILFDMDYPGHYMRRIKSVSLTLPCVVGPYTTVNCTLRLLDHKYRFSSVASDARSYPENTDTDTGTDPRFVSTSIPISSIAASTAQSDSGLFELTFKDERYIPFEGAGAISTWQLSLPNTFRQFDYNSITDAILQIRYTSVDGGDKLSAIAAGCVTNFTQAVEDVSSTEGLFTIWDLKAEFSSDWFRFATAPAPAAPGTTPNPRTMTLLNLKDRMPIFTRSAKSLTATDIYLFSSVPISVAALALNAVTTGAGGGGDSVSFTQGAGVGSMSSYTAEGITLDIESWQFSLTDQTVALDRALLVIRYTMKLN